MNDFEVNKALCCLHGLDYRLACPECQEKYSYMNSRITNSIHTYYPTENEQRREEVQERFDEFLEKATIRTDKIW